MTPKERKMKKEAFSAFDAADYLKSEEDVAAYLEAATEDGDPQILVAAMGDIVRARNLSRIARDAGLTREGMYKALSPQGNPSFATVWKVAKALDMQLAFRAKAKRPEARAVHRKAGASDLAKVKAGTRRGPRAGHIDLDDPLGIRDLSKALGVSSSRLRSALKQANAGAAKRRSSTRAATPRRSPK